MLKIAFGLLLIAAALMLAKVAYSQTHVQLLVCPSHLSYCYTQWKPILPDKRVSDELDEIEARLNARQRALDARHERTIRAIGRLY